MGTLPLGHQRPGNVAVNYCCHYLGRFLSLCLSCFAHVPYEDHALHERRDDRVLTFRATGSFNGDYKTRALHM